MLRPDIKLVRRWLDYDPIQGTLIRRIKAKDNLSDIIPLDKRVYFLGRRYPYSHVVWAIHYGKWPDIMIDHKDHNQLNFKIGNLREATQNQNQHNKRGSGQHGKGVAFDSSVPRSKPWIARIMVNNESIFLGSFETKEEAKAAYDKACLEYHGEFACLS